MDPDGQPKYHFLINSYDSGSWSPQNSIPLFNSKYPMPNRYIQSFIAPCQLNASEFFQAGIVRTKLPCSDSILTVFVQRCIRIRILKQSFRCLQNTRLRSTHY